MQHTLCRAGMAFALSAAALFTALTAHAADDWEAMRQGRTRDDVSTWARSVEGMAVKEFRGVVEVRATAWAALALLADTRNLANWVFQGQLSEHPEGTPANQVYLRFKGLWPAGDRDVSFKTVVSQRPDSVIVVDSRQVDGYPKQDGYVRMPYFHNVFRLTPLKGGWTKVEFETQIDLGGMVPAWLANAVSTKAPLVTLQNLQQQISKPAYQLKTAAELPQQYLRGAQIVLPAGHLAE
ncbi:START domain-containing protein [Aquabacterium sp.]|uniref:START domain-containing protein n=1 Tax=Aquabacterium sp. TaxID=1872578 RepID=UPI0035AE3D52